MRPEPFDKLRTAPAEGRASERFDSSARIQAASAAGSSAT